MMCQAHADPDLPVRAGALFRSIELGARVALRLRKEGIRKENMNNYLKWALENDEHGFILNIW